MPKDSPSIYLPMDRRQAMARGQRLPERATGAALFADISGFTPLTEGLTHALGARRGAEELTRQLNTVYDALISQIQDYRGSVIGFSGDAITCWFDGANQPPDQAALRATACAQTMQHAMRAFAAVPLPGGDSVSLTVKTALASGPARRFQVGDPNVQLLDVLAGATLQRMSHAEHVANRGEIVVDRVTATLLGDRAQILEWRTLDESGESFAVLSGVPGPVECEPWETPPALTEQQVRPWLLSSVYERLRDDLGDFLTELRPAVAVFLRFSGIDYDTDEGAADKLNAYVVWVQSVLTRYEGILVDITIGDKGSYLYGVFGAPVAHEDDARRAIHTALELCGPPPQFTYIEPVQIGVSSGIMRTGPCGGTRRRTYAVLGDEVNLAARLMQNAAPGTALVSGRVQALTETAFAWESLLPIRVKGKSQPVPVARPLYEVSALATFITFSGALVGRDAELAQLIDRTRPIFAGRFAGLGYVHGEPGMGKSRLLFELQNKLNARVEWPYRWLTCAADQILQQSLYPFRQMLRRYFGVAPDEKRAEAERKTRFDTHLNHLLDILAGLPSHADLRRELDKRRSFLGALLNLQWAGSAYEQLEPKLRFENTLMALKMLILAESVRQPVILHLEDAQRLDADSQQFLEMLTQGIAGYPLAILASCRYRDDGEPVQFTVSAETQQYALDLNRLTADGVGALTEQALGLKPDEELLGFLVEKTDGNPFFIEQLVLDLNERSLLTEHDNTLHLVQTDRSELPIGINATLVARLDRLESLIKAVVQIASVVGNEFELRVLTHVLKDDEALFAKVKHAEADGIWAARTEAEYLFRHILLRDAAYEMQLHEHLRQWHRRIGEAIETLYSDSLPIHAASLSYHFKRAEDHREYGYSRMAGERAVSIYANTEAIVYLSRALELAPESDLVARYDLLQLRSKVYDLQGARPLQAQDLQALAALAEQLNDDGRRVEAALGQTQYAEVTGDFPAAAAIAQQAIHWAQQAHGANARGEAFAHYYLARALWRQARYGEAQGECELALALARSVGATDVEARTVLILGNIAYAHNDYGLARLHYEQALVLRRVLSDRQGEAIVLGNLGNVAYFQNDLGGAANYFEQNLQRSREIGDRRSEGIALSNLGNLYGLQGDFEATLHYYEQALALNRATADRRSEAITLNNLSEIALKSGDYPTASAYNDLALRLAQTSGDRQNELTALAYGSMIAEQTGDSAAAYEVAQGMRRIADALNQPLGLARALTLIGHAALGLGRTDEAIDVYQQALAIRQTHPVASQPNAILEPAAGLARALLIGNRPMEAVAALTPILDTLQSGTASAINNLDDPFRVYLTAGQALNAVQDLRAHTILQTAAELLQRQNDRIGNETIRHQWAENVPSHRELRRVLGLSEITKPPPP